MSEPLAYLITWTCYGNWLHGDRRGSVDREHNIPATPFLPEDDVRRGRAQAEMQAQALRLKAHQRKIVGYAITDHCALRRWRVHALNVRSNHVHVVVSCGDLAPEMVMAQLKAWCTRRLREEGSIARNRKVWTRHGSTRYLWNEREVAGAMRYVTQMQG